MSSLYKLLLVDVDGTLVDKKSAISAEDIAALRRARDSGIQVSLCTGRAVGSCVNIFSQLSLDGYHIFYDGALIANHDGSKEVYAQILDPDVVKEAVEFAHSKRIDLDLYSTSRYFVEHETWSAKAHREFFGMDYTITDFDGIWKRERIIKIGLVTSSAFEREKIKSFNELFNGTLHFSWARAMAYPGVDFINVVAPGVSKGKAVEVLASYLRIPGSQVVAIGDGINDIPLLSAAGLAIAMGNAPDEVKKVAHQVTLDVTHSGLAAAVNGLLS